MYLLSILTGLTNSIKESMLNINIPLLHHHFLSEKSDLYNKSIFSIRDYVKVYDMQHIIEDPYRS